MEIHLKRDGQSENKFKDLSEGLKSRVRHCYTDIQAFRAGVGWLWLDHRQRGCLKINLVPFSGVSEEEAF